MDREEIITAFKNVLDEFHAQYNIDSPREDTISFSWGFTLEGKISQLMGICQFWQTYVRILAVPVDDPVVPENRTEMLRFLAMVNQDRAAGCFEYDMETGEIRSRFFVDCDGYATLPPDSVRHTLLLPFQMFQRWGDAIVAVATGASDAATAFAAVRPDDGGDEDEED